MPPQANSRTSPADQTSDPLLGSVLQTQVVAETACEPPGLQRLVTAASGASAHLACPVRKFMTLCPGLGEPRVSRA